MADGLLVPRVVLSFEGARRVAVCASNRIVFVVEHDKTLASALVRGGSDGLVCSPLRPSTHRTRLVYSPAHERARGALALRGLRSSRLRVAWDASRPWSHRSSSPCSIFTTGLWVGLPWPSPATARPVAGPRRLTRTSPASCSRRQLPLSRRTVPQRRCTRRGFRCSCIHVCGVAWRAVRYAVCARARVLSLWSWVRGDSQSVGAPGVTVCA